MTPFCPKKRWISRGRARESADRPTGAETCKANRSASSRSFDVYSTSSSGAELDGPAARPSPAAARSSASRVEIPGRPIAWPAVSAASATTNALRRPLMGPTTGAVPAGLNSNFKFLMSVFLCPDDDCKKPLKKPNRAFIFLERDPPAHAYTRAAAAHGPAPASVIVITWLHW
eukprot:scaffold16903_cov133-Isochrysis_galbana.AAC.1